MSSRPPSAPAESPEPLLTREGIPMVVDHSRSDPFVYEEARAEQVVVRPPGHPRPRDTFMAAFRKDYARFIEVELRRKATLSPASVEDLGQLVLEVVDRHHGGNTLPAQEKMRAFLRGIVRKLLLHRWRDRARGLDVDRGADLEALLDDARSPESRARLVEYAAKLQRYLAELSKEEAEVVECVELQEMSIADAATELGLPYEKAYRRYQRGRKKLEERARASEAAAAARLARPTGG